MPRPHLVDDSLILRENQHTDAVNKTGRVNVLEESWVSVATGSGACQMIKFPTTKDRE